MPTIKQYVIAVVIGIAIPLLITAIVVFLGGWLIALPFGLGIKGIFISLGVLALAFVLTIWLPPFITWKLYQSRKLTIITIVTLIIVYVVSWIIKIFI